MEFQGANDFSNWVINASDPLLRHTLNLEDLRLNSTQGSLRRGRGLLWQRREVGWAARSGNPALVHHEANDRSDGVNNAFDPMDLLTLNPEVLKPDATQEFFAEGADSFGIGRLRAQVEEGAKVTGRTEEAAGRRGLEVKVPW